MTRENVLVVLLGISILAGCRPTAADQRAAEESIRRIYHPTTRPYVARDDASNRELASQIAALQLGESADEVARKAGEPNCFGVARRKDDLVGAASGSTWTYRFSAPSSANPFDPDNHWVDLYFDASNRLRGVHAHRVAGVTSRGAGAETLLFPLADAIAIGDRVVVEKHRKWMDATVVGREGNRVRVHFDDPAVGEDEWVRPGDVAIRQ